MSRAGPFFALKIASLRVGTWIPSNTWFHRLTRVHIPNGITIGSAVFAEITVVADRQTARQTTLLRP